MDLLLVLLGLIGLFLGGELLVRGSVALAYRLAISPLLVGLTVVGFGTSTPELLVSLDAAWRGLPDIALGNVVGSNTANVLLIIGLSALVWPIAVTRGALRRDCAVMMLASLVLVPTFAAGGIGRFAGVLMLGGLIGYLVWAYRSTASEPSAEAIGPVMPAWRSLSFIVTGLITLMLGARMLVDGAVSVAEDFGLSEAFIGLTVVAVGTSLPELATSLVAALRRQPEVALGNVVGSNIFNVLGILGLTAIIVPIPVAARFLYFDLPVMLAASAALSVLLMTKSKLGRVSGLLLLGAYLFYVWGAQG